MSEIQTLFTTVLCKLYIFYLIYIWNLASLEVAIHRWNLGDLSDKESGKFNKNDDPMIAS